MDPHRSDDDGAIEGPSFPCKARNDGDGAQDSRTPILREHQPSRMMDEGVKLGGVQAGSQDHQEQGIDARREEGQDPPQRQVPVNKLRTYAGTRRHAGL